MPACGDYIRKHGELRPQECWDKNSTKKPGPRKRGSKRPKPRGPVDFTSDLPNPSSEWDVPNGGNHFGGPPLFNDPFLPSEGPTPMPPPTEQHQEQQQQSNAIDPNLPDSQAQHSQQPNQEQIDEMNSEIQWDEVTAMAALQHAIQASPARALGSKASPVEVNDELTPNHTRRLLFPSPRKTGEFKSLDEDQGSKSASTSPTPMAMTDANAKTVETTPAAQQDQDLDPVDKENLPPMDDDDDDFPDLFDNTLMPETPGKLTPSIARSIANLVKTPTPLKSIRHMMTPRSGSKRSGDHLVSPTASRRRSTPRNSNSHSNLADREPMKPMTPCTAALNQFLSDDFHSSPGARAFNWAIHSSPRTGGAFDSDATGFDMGGEVFTSDFPGLPSSPPLLSGSFGGGGDLGFEMFEDATATESLGGVWEGGFFGSEGAEMQNQDLNAEQEQQVENQDGAPVPQKRKRESASSRIDFAKILEEGQGIEAAVSV